MLTVYYTNQMDGIISAAIFVRYCRFSKREYRLEELHPQMIGNILKYCDDKTILLDFPARKKLLKNLPKYWATNDSDTNEGARIFDYSKDKCTAQLVKERFLDKDKISLKLSSIAHDYVYDNNNEELQKLKDTVHSDYSTTKLIDLLSKGIFWTDNLEQIRNEYHKQKAEAMLHLLKSLTIKPINNNFFGYVDCSTKISSTDASEKIFVIHKGVDVVVIIYKNGEVIFRKRNTCSLDMLQIAKLFDGGGNVNASGTKLEKKTFATQIEKIHAKIKTSIVI